MNQKRASDSTLLEAYARLGNCAAVAREVGFCTQSVHERLNKLGTDTSTNRWSEADDQRLHDEYLEHRDVGQLDVLASKMGRTKQFVCRKARALGLTDRSRPAPWLRTWASMTEDEAAVWLTRFRTSNLGLSAFCKEHGFGEVGFWQTMTKYFPGAYEAIIESKVPLGSKYRVGRAFEYRTMSDLKTRGFFVYLAPGSRSPIDVVAIRRGEVLMIQCRIGGALVPEEWNELLDLASSSGATAVKASAGSHGGVEYMRLVGPKEPGSRVREPGEVFAPGEVTR